ncbi:MAG TPA: hypothetical protein VHE79_16140, partial [Spirochaetia bacterium]
PAPTRPRPRVRDLLFVPSDAVRGAAPGTAAPAVVAPRSRDLPRRGERAAFSAALRDELAVIRADGERLRYAAEI